MKTITITPNDKINDTLEINGLNNITLLLTGGLYFQKVKIKGHNVILKPATNDEVVICYDDYNYKIHEDGLLYNTFRTHTLVITGSNVTLENLVIQNSAGRGKLIGQAVALSVYGDNNTFNNCRIIGHQDTIFLGPLPLDLIERYAHILPFDERTNHVGTHKFSSCEITGDVDFIFGSGNALFNNCNIIATNKGYIAAPSHYDENQIGFVFYECNVVNISDEPITLARPWREHGRATFINCNIKGLIGSRYTTWDKTNFYFSEYPYVEDDLSRPISKTTLNQIIKLFE